MDSRFDDEVSSANNFDNSLHPHLRDNVEWSINVETEVIVHSLDSVSSGINIDDVPSLASLSTSWLKTHFLSFFILASIHLEALLVVDILEVVASVSEELPPSRVGAPHSDVMVILV